MSNFISFIPNLETLTELAGNCIIQPEKENNFLCCYRTTMETDRVRLSFDGYSDLSCAGEGASPKMIMDNARRKSFEQISEAWKLVGSQGVQRVEKADKQDSLSVEAVNQGTSHDVVPEFYRAKKFCEPMAESQGAVVYAVAKHNGSTPEAFVQEKLGKDVADLTKGEVTFLSDKYGVKHAV